MLRSWGKKAQHDLEASWSWCCADLAPLSLIFFELRSHKLRTVEANSSPDLLVQTAQDSAVGISIISTLTLKLDEQLP